MHYKWHYWSSLVKDDDHWLLGVIFLSRVQAYLLDGISCIQTCFSTKCSCISYETMEYKRTASLYFSELTGFLSECSVWVKIIWILIINFVDHVLHAGWWLLTASLHYKRPVHDFLFPWHTSHCCQVCMPYGIHLASSFHLVACGCLLTAMRRRSDPSIEIAGPWAEQ